MNERYVVVTTEHRGVFFGVYESGEVGGVVVLSDAQCCIYWSRDTRGFLGLASTGPLDGSRCTAVAPKIEIAATTSITDCSDAAVTAWRGLADG